MSLKKMLFKQLFLLSTGLFGVSLIVLLLHYSKQKTKKQLINFLQN